ncbi:type I polyketide synthase [Pseudomonas sp. REB1044]|uniref:type I polyketide synthase n=1 Tax=Pseudomonas sp. REB1044 TaxID=2675224 RepID=UPI00315D92E9
MKSTYETVLRIVLDELAQAANVREIDAQQRLGSLGLDSITITDLISTLESRLDRELEPTLFWHFATPEHLCRHLCGESSIPAASAVPSFSSSNVPVAIVGIACCFPGAADIHAFWRLLVEGRTAVGPLGSDHFDEQRDSRWHVAEEEVAGFITQPGRFDPQKFGLGVHEATQMDPQQRLLLTLSWAALEQAAMPPSSVRGQRGGVFIGAMWCDFAHHITPQQMTAQSATGLDTSLLSARISFLLGLTGPSLTVNTACSSSLVALHLACQSIKQGECDFAVVGGVNLMLAEQSFTAMRQFGGLSATSTCHAFDAAADGYVRAEGAGVVVVRRLPDALAQASPIWGVVRSSVVNNNGFHASLTAPSLQAQQALLEQALQRAGVPPEQVEYVEAHGTGTAMGDPIEATALAAAYCPRNVTRSALLIGSVKTNIGHSEAAAGMAGLIKVLLAMQYDLIPAQLHYAVPNPAIDWSRLALQPVVQNTPWRSTCPTAGVSSFGFGGTNAHVIVSRQWPTSCEPLQQTSELVVVPASPGESSALLVFSGQGGHWQGMGLHLARLDPELRQTIAQCDKIFVGLSGWSLAERLYDEAEDFSRVEIAWPCHFAIQVALARLWIKKGLKPAAVIGHSIGEVAAAHVAGMLSLQDALTVIYAQSCWAASQPGEMALLGLSWDQTESLLSQLRIDARVAIQHTGQETVISGSEQALATVQRHCQGLGTPFRRVHTHVRVHAASDDQAYSALSQALQEIVPTAPQLPLFGAGNGGRLLQVPVPQYWAEAVARPIRWFDALCESLLNSTGVVVEVASHPVLQHSLQAAMKQTEQRRGLWVSARRGWCDDRAMADVLRDLAMENPAVDGRARALLLSAHSPGALRAQVTSLLAWLQDYPDVTFEHCCAALRTATSHERHRLASVCSDRHQAVQWLRALAIDDAQPSNTDQAVVMISTQPFLHSSQRDALLVFDEFRAGYQRVLQVARQMGIDGPWLESLALAIGCVVLLRERGVMVAHYRIGTLSGKMPQMDLPRGSLQALLRAACELTEADWQTSCAGGIGGTAGVFDDLQGHDPHHLLAQMEVRCFLNGSTFCTSATLSQPPLALPTVYGPVAAPSRRAAPYRLVWRAEFEPGDTQHCPKQVALWGMPESLRALFEQRLGAGHCVCIADDGVPDLEGLAAAIACAAIEHVFLLLEPEKGVLNLVETVLAALRLVDRVSSTTVTLHVFTVGAHGLAGDSDVMPDSTLLWGVLRTALLELDGVRLCMTDLPCLDKHSPDLEQWLSALQASLACPLTQSVWRAGQRLSPVLEVIDPVSPQAAAMPGAAEGFHLVTGGLGALGQALVQSRIDAGEQRFLLIGRRSPSQAVEQTLQRWRKAGVTVLVEHLDAADARSLSEAVERSARQLGPLTRISHAAGTLEGCELRSVDSESLLQQMSGKREGAWNLHCLSLHWPVREFLLVSSVSSFLGFPGYAGYAGANAYLDGLAHYRRNLALPATSVRFGPFKGAGLLGEDHVFAHLPAITLSQGLRTLADYGEYDIHPTIMAYGGPTALGRTLRPVIQRDILHLDARDRHAQLSEVVRRYVAALLQEPVECIADDVPLSDLGISSLLGVEIRNRLQAELQVRMPATVLWNYPTIHALAEYLESLLWPGTDAAGESVVADVTADEDDDALMAELLRELATIQEKFKGGNV